jgi:hypothetical protein
MYIDLVPLGINQYKQVPNQHQQVLTSINKC